jgi:hypothetical protein
VNTLNKLVAGALALSVLACGREPVRNADSGLENDLKMAADANLRLANQQPGARFAATEVAPPSTPAPAPRVRQAPSGTRAIASPMPSFTAQPEPTVAATVEIPQVQEIEYVPAPAVAMETVPAVRRPVPSNGGHGDIGMGSGGVIYGDGGPGVVIVNGPGTRTGGGIVIRTGGRDDDNCEAHTLINRRVPQGTIGGRTTGVYVPNPGRVPVAVGAGVGRPSGAVTTGGTAAGGSTAGVPRRTRGGSE